MQDWLLALKFTMSVLMLLNFSKAIESSFHAMAPSSSQV